MSSVLTSIEREEIPLVFVNVQFVVVPIILASF
jgi:hypothetical protein